MRLVQTWTRVEWQDLLRSTMDRMCLLSSRLFQFVQREDTHVPMYTGLNAGAAAPAAATTPRGEQANPSRVRTSSYIPRITFPSHISSRSPTETDARGRWYRPPGWAQGPCTPLCAIVLRVSHRIIFSQRRAGGAPPPPTRPQPQSRCDYAFRIHLVASSI